MNHKLIDRIYYGEDLTWRSKEILPQLKVGFCTTCGFYHAYPYPDKDFLRRYYSTYEIPCPLHQEERDRIARILKTKIEASAAAIDIGCGKGEMLASLMGHGFTNLFGSEFGFMREKASKLEAVTILPYSTEDLVQWCKRESRTFDCALLINVVEHVPEPIDLFAQMKSILSPEGIIMFSIPNDFNVLQQVYLEKSKQKPWFLILPDHLNFISLERIDGVMNRAGYEVIYKTVQYPMELFLLQGDDYVSRPEIGKDCHAKRVEFERSLLCAGKERVIERLYEGFANAGVGRDMYVIAKPRR